MAGWLDETRIRKWSGRALREHDCRDSSAPFKPEKLPQIRKTIPDSPLEARLRSFGHRFEPRRHQRRRDPLQRRGARGNAGGEACR